MSMQRKCDNFFTYFDGFSEGGVDWFLKNIYIYIYIYICNNTINTINLFSFRDTPIFISDSECGDDEFRIR